MHHFQKEKNSTKCIGHQNDNKENARPWQTKTFIQLWFLYLIIPGTRFTRICLVPSHSTTSPGYFGNLSSLSSLKYSEDSPHNLPLYYTYTYTELFHHCQVISPLRTVPKIYHYVPKSLLTQNCFRYNYVLSEPSVWHENWVNSYMQLFSDEYSSQSTSSQDIAVWKRCFFSLIKYDGGRSAPPPGETGLNGHQLKKYINSQSTSILNWPSFRLQIHMVFVTKQTLLERGSINQNGNLKWHLPWRGGSSVPLRYFEEKILFKNHPNPNLIRPKRWLLPLISFVHFHHYNVYRTIFTLAELTTTKDESHGFIKIRNFESWLRASISTVIFSYNRGLSHMGPEEPSNWKKDPKVVLDFRFGHCV